MGITPGSAGVPARATQMLRKCYYLSASFKCPANVCSRERGITVRNTVRRWLTVIAAAGGLLIAGSSAIPAQAATSFHICLKSATSYCLQSNGGGSQVTITNNPANYSNFTSPRPGQFQNGNGNCLRAGTNNVVKIENGPCVASDPADSWYAPPGQTYRLASQLYRDDMTVHGPVNGYNVWHINPGSGDWYNWVAI
jgi:hypothetical protein